MATIIQANYETLQAIAARFGQQAEATNQMAQAVQRAQQQLQSGGWIGRGSEAFNAEMEREVNPAVLRLVDALLQASQVTKQICQLLQGADEEASSPFRAGTSAGGGNGFAGGGNSGNNGVWGENGTYNPGAGGSDILGNIVDRVGFNGGGGAGTGGGGGLPSGTTGVRAPAGANDYGIPHDWLAGVNDSLKDYMNSNHSDKGLPSDWLGGVKEALGLGGDSGGGSSRMDSGGGGSGGGSGSTGSGMGGGTGTGSGAGAGMGSGSMGGGTGGGMGSGGGSMGGGMGSPGGGTGGGTGGGMPSDSFGSPSSQGGGFPGGAGSVGSAEGAAAQSAMRYQSLGGGSAGSAGGAAGAANPAGSSSGGGGVPAADAAPSTMGIPIGIAVASPFLALLGKAIRKRSEDN